MKKTTPKESKPKTRECRINRDLTLPAVLILLSVLAYLGTGYFYFLGGAVAFAALASYMF